MSRELERLAGSLIVGGFDGTTLPPETASLLRSGRLGGVILFSRNVESPEQVAELVRAVRRASPQGWIAVDQEGGRVQRLRAPFPELPPMRRLGEEREPELAGLAGRILGRALAALGIDQDYAPVLDVDTNPDNPVIGDRAFSHEVGVVAELGARFVEALQAEGVAACGKHFPGHGDTTEDSHFELPCLDHDLDRLAAVELVPFAAAIGAGVATIMTAHVLFPALDPEHPATVSERILVPLLREGLGFGGVIVSDDLEMEAVADRYGVADAAVLAVRAGCDQLPVCSSLEEQEAVHEALLRAVSRGKLSRERLAEAAARVAALRKRFPPREPRATGELAAALPGALHRELLDRLA